MLANKPIEELDVIASYTGEPIRHMTESMNPFETEEMSSEWKEAIKSKEWATTYEGEVSEEYKPMLKLRDRLLAFGGQEACMPFLDEDLNKIQERGQLWGGNPHIMIEGAPSRCHTNSSLLWSVNKHQTLIATGYALSKDGMWRQHSWCIGIDDDEFACIIETTEKRVLYFGFVLNEEESEAFLYANT